MPVESVEREILEILEEFAASDFISVIRAELDRLVEAVLIDSNNDGIAGELKENREQLARLEDIYIEGHIKKDSYVKRRAVLQAKIAELTISIEKRGGVNELHQVVDRVSNILGRIPTADKNTLKGLVNMLFERVEIANGTIVNIAPRPWASPFFRFNNGPGGSRTHTRY